MEQDAFKLSDYPLAISHYSSAISLAVRTPLQSLLAFVLTPNVISAKLVSPSRESFIILSEAFTTRPRLLPFRRGIRAETRADMGERVCEKRGGVGGTGEV